MESLKIYEKILKASILTANSRGELFQALQHAPDSPFRDMHPHPVTDHIDAINRNRDEVAAIIAGIVNHKLTDQQRVQMDKYLAEHEQFLKEGLEPACAAILAGDYRKANEILVNRAWPQSIIALDEAYSLGKTTFGEEVVYSLSAMAISVVVAIVMFVVSVAIGFAYVGGLIVLGK